VPAITRRRLLAGSLSVAAAAAIAPASADVPLNVGVFPTEGSAEAFYATELGYFKDAGIAATLTPIASASAIATALSAGSLDIGYGSVVPVATARSRGIPFRIIAPAVAYDGPPATLMMAVDKASPIKAGADLNGSTIGVNGLHEFSDLIALAWIDKNGGDLKTIKVAEIPFAEMAAALKQGRVSAVAISEP